MKKYTDEYANLIRSVNPEFTNETREHIEYIDSANVFGQDITWYDVLVYEGLIMTYPSKKLLIEIFKLDGGAKFRLDTHDKSDWRKKVSTDINVIDDKFVCDHIHIMLSDMSKKDKLEKLCSLFGYNVIYSSKQNFFIISPKFDKRYRMGGKIPQFLYHITPTSNLKKIKERGLCPYNKKEASNDNIAHYDARVYFFLDKDVKQFKTYAIQSRHKSKKFDIVTHAVNYSGDFVLLTISTKGFDGKIELHADTDFDDLIACWTTQSIPPSAIVKIENLEDATDN